MKEAVIFDMDGVIVDSEPCHEKAFLEVIEEIGYGGRHGLDFKNYVGRTDHELWIDFLSKHNPPHTMEELLARKSHRVVEIMRRAQPLFAGLPELVEKLSRRYRLALASGSERLIVEAVLAMEDLRRFFGVTLTATEVRRGKPEPDIFLRAAELLGVEPCHCWIIEDSKPGVAAGLAAGMRVIAITNTHPAADLRHATRVVGSYREIQDILLA